MGKKNSLLELLDSCADQLHKLNQRFPNLASKHTKQSVEHWQNSKTRIRIHMMSEKQEASQQSGAEVKTLALGLLESNGLEDTLDILLSEHKVDLTLPKLIHLVGKEAYISALRRDARLLRDNAISFDQIAELWNDLDRPAMGSNNWSARSVSILVE